MTDADGRFSIAAVPAWLSIDGVSVQADSNTVLYGCVRALAIVQGGVTDAGVIVVRSLCEAFPTNCLDNDGDGLPNTVETTVGLSASRRDSNNIGVPDGAEDYDADGLSIFAEIMLGTKPKLADSDRDGLSDFEEVLLYGTDPLNPDTDGDGWPDRYEVHYGANPRDAASKPALRIRLASPGVSVLNATPEPAPTRLLFASPVVSYENTIR